MDDGDVTFRELEIFLEFSRTQHLGKTAERLNSSVPSIQRAVRRLETRIGVTLVETDGRRIRLSAAGRTLAEQASSVIRARSDALDVVRAASGRRQTLRLGHMVSLGRILVPQLVAELVRREPATRVYLRGGPVNGLVSSVLAGEIDAAFVSPCPIEPDLSVITLFTEPVLLCVSVRSPFAKRSSIDLAELRDEPFIATPEGSGTRHDLFQTCARAGFVPRIVVEVGEVTTMEHMVSTGTGIALVPESMRTYAHPELVRIPLSDLTPPQRTVGLVYPRNAHRNGAFSQLLGLAAQVRDNRLGRLTA
jgi:LysR family transcriptional regulator, transcription activator of glutamate synthase operon